MSRKKSSKGRVKGKNGNKQRSPLLPWVILGGVLLLGAGFLLIPKEKVDPNFVPEVTGAPHLTVDKERIDLGDVPLGKKVWASFKLANVGDQPLVITQDPYVELIAGC